MTSCILSLCCIKYKHDYYLLPIADEERITKEITEKYTVKIQELELKLQTSNAQVKGK